MKKYNYRAKDKQGKAVTGRVEASSPEVAAKLIRERELVLISLKPVRESPLLMIRRLRGKVSPSEVSTFTRQLATMVNAGLPITEALSILRTQARGGMQAVVVQVLADVEGGEPFSKALSKHPKVFTPTYIALIKAGEAGGVMDKVLSRLADNLEKRQEFRGKVKGALIYPTIILIGMVVVGFIMVIFVVPRLTILYTEFDAELPLPTRILIGISTLALKLWPLMLIALASGLYAFRLYSKTPRGRRKLDELLFKIPIMGELQKQIILAELTRSLSLMIGAGVSILEGLNITAGVVGNKVLSEALEDTALQVEKGFPIAYSFARHKEAFPFILSQMIAVGEETGKMEEVLGKISHIFEVESDQKVKGLTSAIEPLVMIVLGLGVGFLVIAIILPIYNLTSQF